MAVKAAAKKGVATKKATTKKKVTRGDAYTCEVCGIVVHVDEICGCVDVCDIVCCGVPMKEKKPARAKVAAKK